MAPGGGSSSWRCSDRTRRWLRSSGPEQVRAVVAAADYAADPVPFFGSAERFQTAGSF